MLCEAVACVGLRRACAPCVWVPASGRCGEAAEVVKNKIKNAVKYTVVREKRGCASEAAGEGLFLGLSWVVCLQGYCGCLWPYHNVSVFRFHPQDSLAGGPPSRWFVILFSFTFRSSAHFSPPPTPPLTFFSFLRK